MAPDPSGGALAPDQDLALRALVTQTPDYPLPGITFLSVHPLLADAHGLGAVVGAFRARYQACMAGPGFYVAGMDARGFTVGAAVALALGVGFVMVRKQGKLPPPVLAASYSLEYGTATIEVPAGVFAGCESARVVVLDDLVATGGTMVAGCELLRKAGAQVVEAGTILELTSLPGRSKLQQINVPLHSLLKYNL